MKASLTETRYGRNMILRWEESGMNQLAFCRKESIQPWKFYQWLKIYRKEKARKLIPPPAGKFIKLTPTQKPIASGVYAEVVFQNGTSIRFHQPVPSAELRQLAGI